MAFSEIPVWSQLRYFTYFISVLKLAESKGYLRVKISRGNRTCSPAPVTAMDIPVDFILWSSRHTSFATWKWLWNRVMTAYFSCTIHIALSDKPIGAICFNNICVYLLCIQIVTVPSSCCESAAGMQSVWRTLACVCVTCSGAQQRRSGGVVSAGVRG